MSQKDELKPEDWQPSHDDFHYQLIVAVDDEDAFRDCFSGVYLEKIDEERASRIRRGRHLPSDCSLFHLPDVMMRAGFITKKLYQARVSS